VIKRQFGYTTVRCKGLAKDLAQLCMLFALSNLWIVRRQLVPAQRQLRLSGAEATEDVP
jgi:IS5 family transposase